MPREREKRRPPIEHSLLRPINARTYSFSKLRSCRADKAGKEREISIPTYNDRVVLAAASRRLEGAFRGKNRTTVMARPGGAAPRATMARVLQYLRNNQDSALAALDICGAYATLPADESIDLLRSFGADERALGLAQRFLGQSWKNQPGVPLGAAFSPLALDAFLVGFDEITTRIPAEVLRWVDDVLVVAPSWRALGAAKQEIGMALPAPLRFRNSPRVALGATRFIGWAITPEGEWWPVGGRWRHLIGTLEQRGEPRDVESAMRGWLRQHALEYMTVADLYRRLPIWKVRNGFGED